MSGLFGKSGWKDMAEILPQIAEGMDVMTQKQGAFNGMTAEAAQNFDELRKTLVQVWQFIGATLVKAINQMVSGIKTVASYLGAVVDVGFAEAGRQLAEGEIGPGAEAKARAREREESQKKEALRLAALQDKVAAERAQKEADIRKKFADKEAKAIEKVTVEAPGAMDRIAKIGGFIGSAPSGGAVEIARRSLAVAQIQADLEKDMAEALKKIEVSVAPIAEE
jgi:hypothetical protein